MKNNNNQKSKNGMASPSQGSSVAKGQPQGENVQVKEGDSSQQRPIYGANAGPNTSSREDQLPSLNDGAKKPGKDTE